MENLGRDHGQVEDHEQMRHQAQVWKHICGLAESMTLKCAVELGIPDIIHKHNKPMTLSELATTLPIRSLNMDRFNRLMRYLVHMKLFMTSTDDSGETTYGLTAMSKLLVKGEKMSLASYVLLQLHREELPIWYYLINGLDGTKTPWVACHGVSWFEKAEEDSEISKLFNDAMTDYTSCMIPAFIQGCVSEGVLEGVRSLVDVAGNSGVVAKAIADAFPHVKCTVMDLPQVIENVTKDPMVDFVAGDMFTMIPHADAVLMKSALHSFNDEDCIKILNKCKEAINSSRGKLIIVEIIIDTANVPEFSSARICMDMEMMTIGGKERKKEEWKNLLHKAGFSHHKIIPIMAMESIIEAYP